MAKTPKFADVTADMPVSEAARCIVRRLIVDAISEAPGVLAGDVEATHDMRVALRKLRTALRTFEDVLPKRAGKHLGTTARRVARKLGIVRDADVHLAVLRPALGGATLEEADGIAHAMGTLLEERRHGLTRLAIELSQLDVNDLLETVERA